jgi:UDP-N-acetylglucosamine 1-carboxyvinyltransferase
MSDTNAKIGHLIQQIRQERGLTQAEFARRLHTSQSAVNRIEKGNQNLSLETLARISDVLQKQLFKLGGEGVNLRIEGGHELSGSIQLKTSKNAAVALLCASLLNHGVTRFTAFPKIEEVHRIIEVLESIGVKVKWLPGNDLEIRRPEKLKLASLNADSARKTRSVLMLVGSLMHEYASFQIPYAGGCKLGERTVAPHLFVLQSFGVSIEAPHGHYEVKVKKQNPGRVVLYEQGNTVTNNALMAAAGTGGTTTIQSASADYMVQDLCGFLMKLGVKIEGFGTTKLKVTGIPHTIKKNITYAPAEDPIEAMFFLSAAVTTNSSITIQRVPVDWIALELLKLEKMGVSLTISERYPSTSGLIELADITVHKQSGYLKPLEDKLHPNVWPGLNPDNLPYFVPIAARINGRTLIHDWMFENRAIYYTEMSKIGMNVELADPHRLYIYGPTKFSAGEVVCPPALRPASLLLIGMLAANGVSTLRNVYTINRGYEDIAERLNSIGAKITVLNDIS